MRVHRIRRVSDNTTPEQQELYRKIVANPPPLRVFGSKRERTAKERADRKELRDFKKRWANISAEEYAQLAEAARKKYEAYLNNLPLSAKLSRLWEDR